MRLRLFPAAEAAQAATRHGVVRLAALALPQQHEFVVRQCADDRELALLTAAAGFDRRLFREIADRAVADALRLEDRGAADARRAEFAARVDAARAEVAARGRGKSRARCKAVLLACKEARAALGALGAPGVRGRPASDRSASSTRCSPRAGCVTRPTPAFRQLPKYLRAAARRAERLRDDVARDRRLEAEVAPFEARLARARRPGRPRRRRPSSCSDCAG